ncbi:DNA-formamidopyrimidine glycosylase family protein [Saccharomonospora sp. CUA-673]|uniref:DNA-formamidopyrimidine glycosylase family protein n=1 Tax=Saccharomonospora sp. CUA-673 TaxID=1904969 RepID=UPI00096A6B1A|nr:DNA-formamidopyrimidine glycosylase family protein [Saccharomonospora sp. CUA-673]
MPELPEVEALAHHLREHAVGRTVTRVDIAALSVLKTVTPAWTELHGRTVTDATRHGKYLDVVCAGGSPHGSGRADDTGNPGSGTDDGGTDDSGTARTDDPGEAGALHLVVHLARAGWLRWSDELSPTPPRPGGKSPLALRTHLSGGVGFDLTEAGTKKGLAAWIVSDPADVPGVAALGPDALEVDRDRLGDLLTSENRRLRTVLTDQKTIAGIGNAYSDEIMHTARLSPYATPARFTSEDVDALFQAVRDVLTSAVERSVGQDAARLKGEKRSGLRVHARTGLPCPVCGDTVREVSFADKAFQYCPTCQTGGKPLADRRLSRLVK